jgi:hypothetical protein
VCVCVCVCVCVQVIAEDPATRTIDYTNDKLMWDAGKSREPSFERGRRGRRGRH